MADCAVAFLREGGLGLVPSIGASPARGKLRGTEDAEGT